jgi:hypothetical protein
MSTTIVSFLLSMKRLSTSHRGQIGVILDTDRTSGNDVIFFTGVNQGLDEIKKIFFRRKS